MHVFSELALSALEYVPAVQLVHCTSAVSPIWLLHLPRLHPLHEACEISSLNFPTPLYIQYVVNANAKLHISNVT